MAELKVKSATVITGIGTDKVSLRLEHSSPFPAMQYEAFATIETASGYGAEWVRYELGIEPKIINTKGN
jgi:hypothetical protein